MDYQIIKTKENYKKYLLSEHWKQLKAQAYETYGYRCFFHRHRTRYVEIHHINYRNWYDCTVRDVIPLCRECHNKSHTDESWLRATKKALDNYWRGLDQPKPIKIFNESDPEWLKEAKVNQITRSPVTNNVQRKRDRPGKAGRVYQIYTELGKTIIVKDEFRKLKTAQEKAKRMNRRAKNNKEWACYRVRVKIGDNYA